MCFVTPESYGPTPPFTFASTDLTFYLDETRTKVVSVLEIVPTGGEDDLVLDGEELEFVSATLNGAPLEQGKDFVIEGHHLTVKHAAVRQKDQKFTLSFVNFVNPSTNTELSGLYKSGQLLCTQCEAEGFRRITYYIDRPDVMSVYRCKLIGDKTKFPVLLSNGNLIEQRPANAEEKTSDNDHVAIYEDPFKKPSYLFAVIAGPLGTLEDEFVFTEEIAGGHPLTKPDVGKKVRLYCYAEEKYLERCRWALNCVKLAMEWDCKYWHRMYDLDRFSIVCIEDFNAGAMENKSLTTYNIACILGDKDTATDGRLQRICTVIGHEYFHNWSGNRVTVESWFNVTLKEGLTNFREQEFDRWVWSEGAKRIEAVSLLRNLQFPEDESPLCHPICPSKYQSIDNFYTMTIYEKGSEVIGMLKGLVGPENFRKGTDHYFKTYDGCAVNYRNFASAIFDASGEKDYEQFFLWYHQKGTPRLIVKVVDHNLETGELKIEITQQLPENAGPDGAEAKPYLMPFVYGVIDKQTKTEIVPTTTYRLKNFTEEIVIQGVKTKDFVISTNRGFACPVIMVNNYSIEDLGYLLGHDTDAFNRWDAGQELMKRCILEKYRSNNSTPGKLDEAVAVGLSGLLDNPKIDREFLGLCLSVPGAAEIQPVMDECDPVLLAKCVKALSYEIGQTFKDKFTKIFEELWADGTNERPWKIDDEACSRRYLRNKCLGYISRIGNDTSDEEIKKIVARVEDYAAKIDTYNDRFAIFAIKMGWPVKMNDEREKAISAFYKLTEADDNLLDDWFAIIASSSAEDALERVQKLIQHPRYAENTNPNRFRSVARVFTRNLQAFHHESGAGYELLAKEIARYDKINAYNSAGVAKGLISFSKFSEKRQNQIKEQIKWLKEQPLSKNLSEVLSSVQL